MKISLEAQEIG